MDVTLRWGTDGGARFYGSAVAEPMRGQGIYREITNARLAYAAANGAKLALVKGRIETSGPILRQAGFTANGQEIVYRARLKLSARALSCGWCP